jgi:hypothetical protein
MATPAAVLSILIDAQTGRATVQLMQMQRQLEATNRHATNLEKSSHRASGGILSIGSAAGRAAPSIRGLASAALAAGGAFAAFAAAKDAVTFTENLAYATSKLSATTGMDAKTASSWIEVMKVRGVALNQVQMGFITLAKQVTAAESGTKKSAETFKKLGVSMDTLKTGDVNKIIMGVADGFQRLHNPLEASAYGSQLFGRNAKALIPILAQGGAGLQAALGQAQAFGAYIGTDAQKKLERYHSALLGFKLGLDGLKISFTESVLPYVAKAMGAIDKFIQQIRSGKGAGGEFANAISTAFGLAKGAIDGLVDTVGGLSNFLTVLEAILATFLAFRAVSAIVSAVTFALNPWTLLFVAVAGAAYLIIKNWREVGPVLTGVFNTVKQAAQSAVEWVTTAWRNAAQGVTTAWRNVSAVLGPTITNLGIIFSRAFGVMKVAIQPLLGALKLLVTVGGSLLGPFFTWIQNTAQNTFDTLIGIFQGAFNIIRGVIAVFAGLLTLDFKKMWNGIKQVFGGAMQALTSIIKGVWNDFYNAGKFIIGAIGSGIKAVWGNVAGILSDFLNALLTPINIVLSAIGVKQIHVNLAGGGGGGAGNVSAGTGARLAGAGGRGGYATGGLVTTPGYFAGEEAPQHPEVILATNPRYRRRNQDLWAQAGRMLGMPGFAQGGIMGQLEGLWTGAGGPAGVARVAAAIALAESGGRNVIQQGQPYATTGWGLWQITPGNSESMFGVDQALLNPKNNARAAVAKFMQAGGSFSPWTTFTSGAYKQYLGGGGGGILDTIGNALLGAAKTLVPGLGFVIDAADAVTRLTDKLPKAPNLPGFLSHLPSWLLGKAEDFIKREAGSLFKAGPGGVAGSGAAGVRAFDGRPVADWITPILSWARKHGWAGAVTSGYRTPGQQMAAAEGYGLGHYGPGGPLASNHTKTAYPGGAVDVTDPAQLASVLRGYPGTPNLVWGGPVMGDLVHFSATGHKIGGIFGRVPYFQPGGIHGVAPASGRSLPYARPRGIRRARTPRTTSTALAHVPKVTSRRAAPKSHPRLPKALRAIPGDFPLINRGISQLSSLFSSRGVVAQLADRYQATDALFQATHPNLQYIVTPTDGSAPYVDQAAVDASSQELEQLFGWQAWIKNYYEQAVGLIDPLLRRIKNETEIRQRRIAAIRKRIAENLARIKAFLAQIDRIKHAGTLDSRASLPFPVPRSGKAGMGERLANAAFVANRRSRGWARSDAIAAITKQVNAIKDENVLLGGSRDAIGTGGTLKTFTTQLTALGNASTSALQYHDDVVGVSGIGGNLNQARVTLAQLQQQLSDVSPAGLQRALAAAGPGTAAATPTVDVALLTQLAGTSAARAAVSEAALRVFQGAGSLLPPYGGSFQTGGVVPGPLGTPRTIIAHGGERVSQTGEIQVQVVILDGAVDPDKIQVVATNAAVQVVRSQARSGSRVLPGAGGGAIR